MHTKQYLGNQIRDNRINRGCGMRRGACRILVEKIEANRLLGKPRCRWDDNVKINVGETGRDKWHNL
jgi:hypothetical protein